MKFRFIEKHTDAGNKKSLFDLLVTENQTCALIMAPDKNNLGDIIKIEDTRYRVESKVFDIENDTIIIYVERISWSECKKLDEF